MRRAAGDEVENGVRLKPFMIYRNLDLMDIHPIQSVLRQEIQSLISQKHWKQAAGKLVSRGIATT